MDLWRLMQTRKKNNLDPLRKTSHDDNTVMSDGESPNTRQWIFIIDARSISPAAASHASPRAQDAENNLPLSIPSFLRRDDVRRGFAWSAARQDATLGSEHGVVTSHRFRGSVGVHTTQRGKLAPLKTGREHLDEHHAPL